jgi:hypothetical protein
MPCFRRADILIMAIRRWCLSLFAAANAGAATLDTVGVTLTRSFDPALVGSGIPVAQVEADSPGWEVNPPVVGQPQSLFTWQSASGSASTFPNALGTESWHANEVAKLFFGAIDGVAPGPQHIDSSEAVYFAGTVVPSQVPIGARVVNQSFVYVSQIPSVDQDYDNYAARYNVLLVSGAGNDGPVKSPATCYNGIAVGAYGGASSIGPTSDGRSKPDICAPAPMTSFSTPLVAGSAALLLQAAIRGDGGPNTVAITTNIAFLKALLLNGALKPSGWSNSSVMPLDQHYGAGMLNVYQSWRQLRGGRHSAGASAQVPVGGAHPPPVPPGIITHRRGWDYTNLTSTVTQDAIRHYFFEAAGASNRLFTLTATLAWTRHRNETAINDLNLFLYNTSNATLVASSQSLVDNVEHLYVANLPPGSYNLQVLKAGGLAGRVTNDETYALAFDFGPPEPAHLNNPQTIAGDFQASLTGEPNQDYRIQSSSDFMAWATVSTNRTSSAGTISFSVNAAPSLKFFRALELP